MGTNKVCAVILAGGRSSRMGSNKALLDFGGKPLICSLIDRVLPVTRHILISTNDCVSYRFLDFPIVADHFAGCGPLAGFHAAMCRSACSCYLILACDLPNLRTPLLQTIVYMSDGYDAAIPRTSDGQAHPLCAAYRRTCLPRVERALERGANKVIQMFRPGSLAVRWIDPDEGGFKDTDLANINTPGDLRKLQAAGQVRA